MLEAKVITAPNSPSPAAKAVTAPARTPGAARGKARDKPIPGSRSQDGGGLKQRRVGRLERQTQRPHLKRETHHGCREGRARRGEGQLEPEGLLQKSPDGPTATEDKQKKKTDQDRRKNQRQMDRRVQKASGRKAWSRQGVGRRNRKWKGGQRRSTGNAEAHEQDRPLLVRQHARLTATPLFVSSRRYMPGNITLVQSAPLWRGRGEAA